MQSLKRVTIDYDTPVLAVAYKSRQVRAFFIGECGSKFALSKPLKEWILNKTGVTCGEVIAEWRRLEAHKPVGRRRKVGRITRMLSEYREQPRSVSAGD
jgi:hypothetical protein